MLIDGKKRDQLLVAFFLVANGNMVQARGAALWPYGLLSAL